MLEEFYIALRECLHDHTKMQKLASHQFTVSSLPGQALEASFRADAYEQAGQMVENIFKKFKES